MLVCNVWSQQMWDCIHICEARHRRSAGSQSVSGLETAAHEAADMNDLEPGGLITIRLPVSVLSRAALREGHMSLIVSKH